MYQESEVKVAEETVLRLAFRLVDSSEDNSYRAIIYTKNGIYAGRTRQDILRLRCPALGTTVDIKEGDTVHLEFIETNNYRNIIWSRCFLVLPRHTAN